MLFLLLACFVLALVLVLGTSVFSCVLGTMGNPRSSLGVNSIRSLELSTREIFTNPADFGGGGMTGSGSCGGAMRGAEGG